MSDETEIANLRLLNESALHDHALRCSKTYRAGKFTRVGSAFVDQVKTDVECLIRELRNKYPTLHPALEPCEEGKCDIVTGALMEKIKVELNRAVARLVQNTVQKQPTVGKTLGRTR